MKLDAALALANQLLAQHGIQGWTPKMCGLLTLNGGVDHDTQTMWLSGANIRMNDEAMVRDLVLHEIAHILAGPEHNHDEEWVRIAKSIGCLEVSAKRKNQKAFDMTYARKV
jgi:hypothetical protein